MNWLEFTNSKIKKDFTNNQKGSVLEDIAKKYFEQSYDNSQVFFFKTWAISNKLPIRDYGIDLIMIYENLTFGIQVKYRSQPLNYSELSTFFSEVGNLSIIDYGIIFTNSTLTQSVKNQLAKYNDSYYIVDHKKLSKEAYKPSLNTAEIIKEKSLRDYQQTAIDNTIEIFKNKDRCHWVIPCGGGKTFTAIKLAEKLYKNTSSKILIAVPSLALVSQFVNNFKEDFSGSFEYSINCSDKNVEDKDDRSHYQSIKNDNVNRVSTDLKFHKERINKSKDLYIVFSTYQSMDVFKNSDIVFDLLIADEAHHTAGVNIESLYSYVLYDSNIEIHKRLFMSATPRQYRMSSKTKNLERRSMDDETLYGPCGVSLCFSDLIPDYLTPYKLYVIFTTDRFEPGFTDYIKSDLNDAIVNKADVSIFLETVKRLIFNNEKKTIFYLNSVSRAKSAEKLTNNIIRYLKDKNIIDDVSVKTAVITGNTPGSKREALLKNFKYGTDYDFFFFFNVRCLSEGVDIPSLHSIFYVDPKSSTEQIYQSLGRVIRKSPGKKFGNVYIPILINSEELENTYKGDIGQYLENSTSYQKEGHSFKNLLEILIRLSSDSSILKDLATLYSINNENYETIIRDFVKILNVEFLNSTDLFDKLNNVVIWKTIFNSSKFTRGDLSKDFKMSVLVNKYLKIPKKEGRKRDIEDFNNLKKDEDIKSNKSLVNIVKEVVNGYKKKIMDGKYKEFTDFLKRDGRVFRY